MQRILITVQHLDLGGMEKIATELALGIHSRGHEVTVVGIYGGGAHADRLRAAGVNVQTNLARSAKDVRAFARLSRICRDRRVDFAITAMGGAMHAPSLTLLVCRWLGIPAVRWFHTTPGNPLSFVGGMAQRLMTWAGNRVVALTQTHAKSLVEHWHVPMSQIDVIWNGQPLPPRRTTDEMVRVRSELGISEEAFVVGMVAGFRPVKRHEILIQAVRRAVEQVPNLHLLFVGGGPTREDIEVLVNQLDLAQQVTFTGPRTDAARLYAAMNAHVLCSYPAETFPLCMTEAMAAGVVTISTKVGGVPELVTDGQTGVLVEPESPEVLADALVRLASDPDHVGRMTEAAYRFAIAHFSLDSMVDGFLGLCERTMAEGSSE